MMACGRVGPKPCDLVMDWTRPDVVRLTCRNNPSFWLEVDVDSRAAYGSVRGCRAPGTGLFAVRRLPGGVRVDHPLAPWFWVEMRASVAPVRL